MKETSEKQYRNGQSFGARLSRGILNLFGWKVTACEPPAKAVIIIAPHTSNWDFLIGILGKWDKNLDLKFLSKDSLLRGPLGWWFKYVGAVAVDRNAAHGLVQQVVNEFKQKEHFLLAIAPEGTRKFTPHWKSGFYRIALAAKVPIGLATIDVRKKEIRLENYYMPSGDEAVDMAYIRKMYSVANGFKPLNESTIRLAD
ncbi:MAG: hypothetical protein RLZZ502_1161 [Pseudomonadota bacterium]